MLKAISTITNALGALNYKGTWNASSNTPTLADGTGAKGDYYVVSTAGTQTFGGVQLFFGTGDWIAYNGAVWQRVEGGSDGNFANVTMTSTNAGAAAAPLLDLYRDSASPAASDTLGEIEFNGEDSAGNKQTYGLIHASILSPTSTAEQGQLHFETATAGALTEKMIIGTTNLVVNEIGAVFNVRIEGDTDANLLFTDATNDRVGVGTLSPTVKFEVNGAAKASSLSLTTALPATSGGTGSTSAFTANGLVYASSTSALATGSTLTFDGTNLLVGDTTTIGTGGKFQVKSNLDTSIFKCTSNTTYAAIVSNVEDTNARLMAFQYGSGVSPTTVGTITTNGTVVVYGGTSDYRLKTVVGAVTGHGERIDALEPVEYTWNSNGSHTRGFLAHKFQEVYADSVAGTKDAVDAKGNPEYQSMQAGSSEVIADLVAEIQSLRKRLAILEAK